MVNYTGRPEVFIVDVDEDADSGDVLYTVPVLCSERGKNEEDLNVVECTCTMPVESRDKVESEEIKDWEK